MDPLTPAKNRITALPRKSTSIINEAPPKKTAKLELRATRDELERWRAMAETKGRPLSEIAREAIDGVPVRARYQARRSVDPALLRELARIGNNLNQIARWCHMHKGHANSRDVLLRLVEIDRELAAMRAFYEDKSIALEADENPKPIGDAELPYPTHNRSVGD